MADQQEMTAAERKLAEQRKRWAQNLSTPTIARAGASTATLDLEAQALAYCKEQGHTQRSRGKVACRDCSQEALMGRLGQAREALPPLPAGLDAICYHLDELMQPGGRWALADLVAKVNERRTEHGQRAVTETTVSARIRDMRQAGRHIEQAVDHDAGAVYWYPRPGMPAPLGE